jgi:hypothetical protein
LLSIAEELVFQAFFISLLHVYTRLHPKHQAPASATACSLAFSE